MQKHVGVVEDHVF